MQIERFGMNIGRYFQAETKKLGNDKLCLDSFTDSTDTWWNVNVLK